MKTIEIKSERKIEFDWGKAYETIFFGVVLIGWIEFFIGVFTGYLIEMTLFQVSMFLHNPVGYTIVFLATMIALFLFIGVVTIPMYIIWWIANRLSKEVEV